jgi:transketolase
MTEDKSTRDAIGDELSALGEKNGDVVVLDADLSVSTQTNKFAKKFPERFFDAGCAEQNMVSVAAGLAASGKIPFASTYAIFASGRAWDQVRSAAHDKLNVKIVVSHAGLTNSSDGASHQSLEDIALMRVLPNMTVIAPADYVEARWAIASAAKTPGTFYIRLNRTKGPIFYDDKYQFKIGKASVLNEGKDLCIIAAGTMVAKAMEVAKLLEGDGISTKVVSMSTIKPLDTDAIISAAKETGAVVTVEEHSVHGGLGSAVAEVLMQARVHVPFKIMGVNDLFGQSGDYEELLKEYGLDTGSIHKTGKQIHKKKK